MWMMQGWEQVRGRVLWVHLATCVVFMTILTINTYTVAAELGLNNLFFEIGYMVAVIFGVVHIIVSPASRLRFVVGPTGRLLRSASSSSCLRSSGCLSF